MLGSFFCHAHCQYCQRENPAKERPAATFPHTNRTGEEHPDGNGDQNLRIETTATAKTAPAVWIPLSASEAALSGN
jgi:hypothetical protein